MTPSCTSGARKVVWLTLLLVRNVLAKCFALSTDHPDHLILFRKYVSKNAAGVGRAVLEGVGLNSETIEACFIYVQYKCPHHAVQFIILKRNLDCLLLSV